MSFWAKTAKQRLDVYLDVYKKTGLWKCCRPCIQWCNFKSYQCLLLLLVSSSCPAVLGWKHFDGEEVQLGNPSWWLFNMTFRPEPGPDGIPRLDTVSVASGEKLLRTVMNDQKLELYGLYGKIMNCGGGGSCGTCIVEILEGSDLLNERTDTEDRYLKKNPNSWRLACQTIVGNKSNFGKVVVQRFPQKKK